MTRNILPESIDILRLEDRLLPKDGMLLDRMDDGHFDVHDGFSQPELQPSNPTVTSTVKPINNIAATSTQSQGVSISKDGKKRIRPVLVQTGTPVTNSPTKSNQLRRNGSSSQDAKKLKGAASSSNDGSFTVTNFTLPVIQPLKDSSELLSIPSVRPFFSVEYQRNNESVCLEFKNNANG